MDYSKADNGATVIMAMPKSERPPPLVVSIALRGPKLSLRRFARWKTSLRLSGELLKCATFIELALKEFRKNKDYEAGLCSARNLQARIREFDSLWRG
jgi:hypothetical protein